MMVDGLVLESLIRMATDFHIAKRSSPYNRTALYTAIFSISRSGRVADLITKEIGSLWTPHAQLKIIPTRLLTNSLFGCAGGQSSLFRDHRPEPTGLLQLFAGWVASIFGFELGSFWC